jgi:hypothetical protein
MTIVSFPLRSGSPAARLLNDEERLRRWYDSLDWSAQDGWYSLHELRAATGIPIARLTTILWRGGWVSQSVRGRQLSIWHGPHWSE